MPPVGIFARMGTLARTVPDPETAPVPAPAAAGHDLRAISVGIFSCPMPPALHASSDLLAVHLGTKIGLH
jgi:hypothetical protein